MNSISLDRLELFSTQTDYTILEKNVLNTLTIPTKKYQTALIIGRFQPLHRGHIFLLHCALRYANSLIICIGSSDTIDADNPFTVQIRQELLSRAIKREGLVQNVKKIFPLPDTSDDDKWLRHAIQQAGRFDVVIGNNDWVNGLFKKAGYHIIEIPFFNRKVYEGKTIRKKLREQGKL